MSGSCRYGGVTTVSQQCPRKTDIDAQADSRQRYRLSIRKIA